MLIFWESLMHLHCCKDKLLAYLVERGSLWDSLYYETNVRTGSAFVHICDSDPGFWGQLLAQGVQRRIFVIERSSPFDSFFKNSASYSKMFLVLSVHLHYHVTPSDFSPSSLNVFSAKMDISFVNFFHSQCCTDHLQLFRLLTSKNGWSSLPRR